MLDELESTLRALFKSRVANLRSGAPPTVIDDQIGFQPPDRDWRTTYLTGLGPRPALNVYLVDLRENLMLRSNERLATPQQGFIREEPAPTRIDCHYLITAWSRATILRDRIEIERRILYDVLTVLVANQPLVPAEIPFPVSPILEGELPTVVAPAEGFLKLAEFWSAMGQEERWKPAVYLIVTIPVAVAPAVTGVMVTTRRTEYVRRNGGGPGDVVFQIGGHVLSPVGAPVNGAFVQLETAAGAVVATTTSDVNGRFTFLHLDAGRYRLVARSAGLGQKVRSPVDVPSPSGEYDLTFP